MSHSPAEDDCPRRTRRGAGHAVSVLGIAAGVLASVLLVSAALVGVGYGLVVFIPNAMWAG